MTEPTRGPGRSPLRGRGVTPWLWAIVALIVIGLLALLIVRALDDDGDGGTTAPGVTPTQEAPPPQTDTGSATTPGGPDPPTVTGGRDPGSGTGTGAGTGQGSGAGRGSLVVAGESIYGALGGNLSQYANQQVEARRVRVISVPGDEVFWAGRSNAQRLLVRINLKGESPPRIRPGQEVTFTGTILSNGGRAYGLTSAEGAGLLRRQAHHALVSLFDLKLR